MKQITPKDIKQVLDLTRKVRQNGGKYVPCFAGDAGIGKSEIIQQWAEEQGEDFAFIDIRLAYMEGPDLIGLPEKVAVKNHKTGETDYISIHALPDFLPRSGAGLILFEEPNRAHESTMNAMMQVLTDRRIHKYELPEGVMMACAINPEGNYTVNTMDPALKNRLAMFDVGFHKLTFVEYIKDKKWDSHLTTFIEKHWEYKAVDEIVNGTNASAKYISPRSWRYVQDLIEAGGRETGLYAAFLTASLGDGIASNLIKHEQEYRPILLEDILSDKKGSLKKLNDMTKSGEYNGDLFSFTVSSVTEGFEKNLATEDLILEVAEVLPVDQSISLLAAAVRKFQTEEECDAFLAKNEKFIDSIKRRQSDVIVKK